MVMTPKDIRDLYLQNATSSENQHIAFDACYAPDIRIHVPGRSRLAGEHKGREGVVQYIRDIRSIADDNNVLVEIVDSYHNDTSFALVLRETFYFKDGGNFIINRMATYKVANGKIYEITIYDRNAHEVDQFTDARLSRLDNKA